MIIMETFDAYRIYQALKLHFEKDSYDAIKYRFKTSANQKAFWKRRDKYQFNKVAKRFNTEEKMIRYYVAHFVNGSTWVGDMLSNEDTYTKWLKRQESLTYGFEQDLYKLEDYSFDQLLIKGDNTHPEIISKYLEEEISLETVVIINKLTGFMTKADQDVTETIVWPELRRKILKYEPFLVIDKEKFKKIVLKVFTS